MRLTLLIENLDEQSWRKSTRSNPSGNCVEWAPVEGGVGVRDSKAPAGGKLAFRGSEWSAFVQGVRNDKFGPAA